MPIGTIDYVSTLPWNDATNPWPQYSRIALSGMIVDDNDDPVYVNNVVLDMTLFDPSISDGNTMCAYESDSSSWTLLCSNDGMGIALFALTTNAGAGLQYNRVNSASRAIPAKNVVGAGTAAAQGWDNSYGVSMDGLLILPVTTYLTPWEHRRRWCLNG
jgi:hypothetical protein